MPTGTTVVADIVAEVADREGVDPVDLDVPLYEVIDVDALDALVNRPLDRDGTDVRVTFTYYGYEVTVTGDSDVTVEQRTPDPTMDDSTTDETPAEK